MNREEDVTLTPRENSGQSASTQFGKQKHRERGCNSMPSGIKYMTALAPNGLPAAPAEAIRLYKRTARFQVRDNVPVTTKDWWLMPEAKRNLLWDNLSEKV